jgi:superfamily I DNA/RNA helicase
LPVSETASRACEIVERVLAAADVAVVTGPPGSGKTEVLAAVAAACAARGEQTLALGSHPSSTGALAAALACAEAPASVRTGMLHEFAAAWMQADYLAAGTTPHVFAGGAGATLTIVRRAARGLLDMTWPMFSRSDINLDLPYLARPDTFLEEAASLFTLLQRSRVSVNEFEEGCNRGLGAFYGEQIERAAVLLADPSLAATSSRRGREAMRAKGATLAAQRKAERDVAAILVALYREYTRAAADFAIRSPEDILDSAVRWLSVDMQAAAAIAGSIDVLIVDDAEDAQPALAPLLQLLRAHKRFRLIIAGWDASRVDGFEGRRSALSSFENATRFALAPHAAPPAIHVRRCVREADEIAWLARAITDVLSAGCRPENIAVLTRSLDAAVLYARQLEAANIPVVMPAAALQRPAEIFDLLAVGAVVENPFDQAHLLRVLSSPVAGLSDAGVRALCRSTVDRQQLRFDLTAKSQAEEAAPKPSFDTLARNLLDGSADDSLSPEALASVHSLRADLERWRAATLGMSIVRRILFLADAAGFRTHWNAAKPFERARLADDMARVAEAAAQIEAAKAGATFGDVEDALESGLVHLRPAKASEGCVVAETVVGVKGRRFDYVFVAGCAHERFPRIYTSHSMAFSRTYGLIIRENVAPGAGQTAKFAWYYARFGAKSMYLDEERRALQYGLARARRQATASGFGSVPGWARDHDLLAALEPSS